MIGANRFLCAGPPLHDLLCATSGPLVTSANRLAQRTTREVTFDQLLEIPQILADVAGQH
jgi:hypothetical protein